MPAWCTAHGADYGVSCSCTFGWDWLRPVCGGQCTPVTRHTTLHVDDPTFCNAWPPGGNAQDQRDNVIIFDPAKSQKSSNINAAKNVLWIVRNVALHRASRPRRLSFCLSGPSRSVSRCIKSTELGGVGDKDIVRMRMECCALMKQVGNCRPFHNQWCLTLLPCLVHLFHGLTLLPGAFVPWPCGNRSHLASCKAILLLASHVS